MENKLKIIELTCDSLAGLDTEIRFNIASERAEGVNLVRFDIKSDSDSRLRLAIKVLRRMKSEGAVQVFASRDSFASEDTEASYINNKYGKILENLPDFEFVIVKI